MRNLIVVAFVEPVAEGLEFPRDDWPLHITLVKFDAAARDSARPAAHSAGSGARGADAQGPGPQETGPKGPGPQETAKAAAPEDPLAETLASLMEEAVAAALGSTLIVGRDEGFGRGGSIPVNLIEPSEKLTGLHTALVRIVQDLPGRISTPAYTLEGFRPHVSHHGDKRLNPGDAVALDRIALVDMAPDGGHATRRVLKLWAGPLG
jgi:hypothetical protein